MTRERCSGLMSRTPLTPSDAIPIRRPSSTRHTCRTVVADLRKTSKKRTQLLTMRLFESEAIELKRLAIKDNRSPGEFMRSLLHNWIRRDKGAEWTPTEIAEPPAADAKPDK